MKKRFAISALALCLALILLPARARAADGGGSGEGGLVWNHDPSTKTTTVSGTGIITQQDVEAFLDVLEEQNSRMGTLIINEGITAIEDGAFADLYYHLSSVTIPGSVSIGEKAFYRCGGLASVTITGDGAKIGSEAFSSCDDLTSVTITGDGAEIGSQAFSSCSVLASLTFSGDVGSIGDEAFYQCSSLTSLTFPGGVDSIGDNAFYWCNGLTSLAFGGDVGSIGDEAFYDCDKLASVTFSGSVGSIGGSAFYYCDKLASAAFSGDVGSIGDNAFSWCSKLTSVTFGGDVGSIGDQAFYYCDKLTSVTFDGSLDSIGEQAFYWCEGLTNLILPNGLTSVGKEAFYFCSNLIRVYLPGTVESIGSDPFEGCGEFRDVYFGGTEEQWKALGGSSIFGYYLDPVPVCHPNTSGFPDTEAGDLETLLRRLSDGIGAGRTDIELTADLNLTETLTIPKGCSAVLDLKGHRITSAASRMIDMLGNLTVLDSTVAAAPTVTGGAVSYTSGRIEATGGDAVYVQPGCTFTLLSGTVKAEGRAVTVYADRNEDGTYFQTKFQMDSGYVEAGKSAVTVLGDGADVDIDGGALLSRDAPVISGGEREEQGGTDIRIYTATLIAKSSTPGNLPCGIYHPQRGSLNLRGVEIHAEGGVGVLMRGGSLSMNDSRDQATRVYAGGSGQGTIGSGAPLSAGQRIVMDQQGGFYDSKSIRSTLYQDMQYRDELIPNAYPAEGYGLRITNNNFPGSSNYDVYSFGRFSTVTLDPNGGEGGGERVTDVNGKIQWPDDPVREGYVFRGWSNSKYDSFRHMITPETRVFDNDTTIYAVWIPEGTYVVSFLRTGGGASFETKVTAINGVLLDWPTSTPISFDGTVFMGWSADPDGGTEYPFDQPFTGDTELYTRWGSPVRPHTITFHLNDGTDDTDTRTTGMDGVLADWPDDPTREGYVFRGWSRSSGYSIMPGKGFAFYEDTDLYARWIPVDGYTITFHPNNGANSETRNTTTWGTLANWPDDPVLTGYTFAGWYSDPKPPAGVYAEPSTAFQGNTSLYAYWIKNGGDDEPGNPKTYTITFDANGGKGGAALTTGANGRLSALPAEDPTRAGYTFSGWYTAASGGAKVTTSTLFQKDATVYAHWVKDGGGDTPDKPDPGGDMPDDTKKSYTITFHANGGSVSPPSAATNDDGKAALPTPVRAGYTFAGWYTAPSGGTQVGASTVFTADTTVYAHWSQSPGTPSITYYQIYTPGVTYGGSIYASHSIAAPGTLVTVTSSPWSSFELSRLSALRVDTGLELFLTGRYGSQYTFLMPDSDVQLTSSYAQTNTGAVNPGYPGTSTGTSGYPGAPAGARPVNWYYSGGRIHHVTDGPVPVETPLTRDMLVSVLYNMDSGSSGAPTIWAAENNIVPDIYQSGLWGADKSISREQAAMILFCYARYKDYATYQTVRLTGYRDYGQLRSIARPAMAWCQATGLIPATSARTLSPQAILTCGEANAILARFVATVAGG